MAVTARQVIELGVSILLPPLAVFIHGGCNIHVLVSIFFCILAWIPAVVHAIWYCFFRTPVYHQPVQQPPVVVTSGRPL